MRRRRRRVQITRGRARARLYHCVLCMFGARLPVGLALNDPGAITVVVTLLGAVGALFRRRALRLGFASSRLRQWCACGMHLAQLFPGKKDRWRRSSMGAPDGPCCYLCIYGSGVSPAIWGYARVWRASLCYMVASSACLGTARAPRIATVLPACGPPIIDEEKPGFVASSKLSSNTPSSCLY